MVRGSRGAVTHGGLSSHPCKHFYKHIDASSKTLTNSNQGLSHEAGQDCAKEVMHQKGKQEGIKRGKLHRRKRRGRRRG